MTEILLADLKALIPSANSKLKEETSYSDEPLYIKFTLSNRENLNSENYSTPDGLEVILDFDKDNKLVGIEFF